MRNVVIGIVFGLVVGVAIGNGVIAPRLQTHATAVKASPLLPAAVPAVAVPAATASAPRLTAEAAPAVPNQPGPRPVAAIEWRMASAFSGDLPQVGALAKRIERNIESISDGSFKITFHEPGALVPPLKMFDAVRLGAIDAAFSSPTLWANKLPALQLFSAIPFGPPLKEYLAWIYFGGGREIFQDLYRKNGIHSLFCGAAAPGTAGWFRKPVRTPADFKGMTMAMTGLGAKVLEKLGVSTTQVTNADIAIAFENGLIDSLALAQPASDIALGPERQARYYYFPGWHQPAALFELMVNLDRWKALPGPQRVRIEAICGENVRYGLFKGEALQFEALKEMTGRGVVIERWAGEIMQALRDAWQRVVSDEIANDRIFARTWSSLSEFRQDYEIWRELSEL